MSILDFLLFSPKSTKTQLLPVLPEASCYTHLSSHAFCSALVIFLFQLFYMMAVQDTLYTVAASKSRPAAQTTALQVPKKVTAELQQEMKHHLLTGFQETGGTQDF